LKVAVEKTGGKGTLSLISLYLIDFYISIFFLKLSKEKLLELIFLVRN